MSEKPLLKKTYKDSFNGNFPSPNGNILFKNDVVEALKKFKKGQTKIVANTKMENKEFRDTIVKKTKCYKCKSLNYIYYNFNDHKNGNICIDCWFKECFGVLPKEVEQ